MVFGDATLRNIANELINRGHDIVYRNRKEGGIEIISIDGIKYSARKGNEKARQMLNQKLSPLLQSHLTTIRRPKGKARVKLPSINVNISKELKKLQKIQRKLGVKERATIKNIRGYLQRHTEEEAITMLKEEQRTYQKTAWSGFYNIHIASLQSLNAEWNNPYIQELINYLMEADAMGYEFPESVYNDLIKDFSLSPKNQNGTQSEISQMAINDLERLKANVRKNRKKEE